MILFAPALGKPVIFSSAAAMVLLIPLTNSRAQSFRTNRGLNPPRLLTTGDLTMSDDVPFAVRRGEMVDRAVAILSTDARFLAGWLEGSLADGSSDAHSDVDLHLPVVEAPRDEGGGT